MPTDDEIVDKKYGHGTFDEETGRYTLTDQNMGVIEYKRAITGEVWLDEDFDGTENDDHPLKGITVILKDKDGKEIARTRTDKDGKYSFENVKPGDYTIGFEDDRPVTAQNGKPEKGKSIADKLHTIDKVHMPTDAEIRNKKYGHGTFDEKTGRYTLTDQNMGVVEYRRAITGIAFLDEDKNGEFGKGDVLMPNETVYLYRVGKNGEPEGDPVATTRTDSRGFYSFEGLVGGTYAVLFGVDLDELAVTDRKNTDNGSKIDKGQLIRRIVLPTDDEIAASDDYLDALDENGCYTVEHMNAGYIHQPAPTATPKPTTKPGTPAATTAPRTVTVTGHKLWDDEGNIHGVRPDSVSLILLADGTPVDATPTWSNTDGDDWTYTYRGLRATTSLGIDIVYTVQEEPVRYYEAEIDGTTITNHLVPESPKGHVDLSGTKQWVDDDDAMGMRPDSITLRLWRDGEVVDTQTVTAANGWSYSFGELPTDDGLGHDYTYELREDGVLGYYATIDGAKVTNTLINRKPGDTERPNDNVPMGVWELQSRHTGTPVPPFSGMDEAELEELFDLFGYGTPLWGMLGTGDETPVWPFAFGGIGALALIALAILKKKRRA